MDAGEKPPEPDAAEIRRSKFIGRTILIGFGLLLLAYVVVTFLGWR
jgi:hypothetical protein